MVICAVEIKYFQFAVASHNVLCLYKKIQFIELKLLIIV